MGDQSRKKIDNRYVQSLETECHGEPNTYTLPLQMGLVFQTLVNGCLELLWDTKESTDEVERERERPAECWNILLYVSFSLIKKSIYQNS